MLITLWVFIGVEGAWLFLRVRVINVMLAKRHCWGSLRSGRLLAGNAAFAGCGGRPELAEIRNPSMAGLMVEMRDRGAKSSSLPV